MSSSPTADMAPNASDSAADWEDFIDELMDDGEYSFATFVDDNDLELGTKAKHQEAWERFVGGKSSVAKDEKASPDDKPASGGSAPPKRTPGAEKASGGSTGDPVAGQFFGGVGRGSPDKKSVARLQVVLGALGYQVPFATTATGLPHGQFEARTQEVVEQFQEDHDLDVTGEIDADTTTELVKQVKSSNAGMHALLFAAGKPAAFSQGNAGRFSDEWTDASERAVKSFQRSVGLEVDGEVDEATLEALWGVPVDIDSE